MKVFDAVAAVVVVDTFVVVGMKVFDTVVAAVVVVVDTVAVVGRKVFDTDVAVVVVVVDTVAVVGRKVFDTVASDVGTNLEDSVAEHVDSFFVILACLPRRKKVFLDNLYGLLFY
jgi:hypothetical protein